MRGKGLLASPELLVEGITPAYAGKSSPLIICSAFAVGSPPRMRGKATCHTSSCVTSRITPAYAGKREAERVEVTRDEDHPRVCGEKSAAPPTASAIAGSPPRMRGKADVVDGKRQVLGITPAYAGKSQSHYADGTAI